MYLLWRWNHFVFLFLGMDCLLHVLMTHCSEVDVVDRAIFYYSLLNGAADSKVYQNLCHISVNKNKQWYLISKDAGGCKWKTGFLIPTQIVEKNEKKRLNFCLFFSILCDVLLSTFEMMRVLLIIVSALFQIQEILSSADLKMTRRQISNIIHSPSKHVHSLKKT